MTNPRLIVGIILMVLGVFFFLNNKNVSEGAFKFYQILYTKKNLRIMFKLLGIFLILGGLALAFID